MIPDLYLIADDQCGLGHIRRQQVLEEQWHKLGGKTHWNSTSKDAVVSIDDYYYPDHSRKEFMAKGNLVVYWTEFGGDFTADFIVNQNIGAEELSYPNAKRTLLGTSYFQLRSYFKTLNTASFTGIFDADKVKRKLSPEEFAYALATSRAVITAAGLAAYESLYLNKVVFLRCVADNQRRTYDKLISGGWAYPYDGEMQDKIDNGWLPRPKKGRTLIDGLGSERVAKTILLEWNTRHG